MAKSPFPAPPSKDGPRANEEITTDSVRLIIETGENIGVVSTREARAMAFEAGLDLIEVSPNADPPVCKLLDLGKFKYEVQKKKAEAKKNQKIIEVKEVKLRPNIDDNDYNIKMRSMERFLDNGDKVKVTLRFRGREMAHQDLGVKLLDRVREQLAERVRIEQYPKLEGRQMVMVVAPK
ncbi:MAG: translation initiation factor IF-3 [Alphaproteobacteria bacterium RIFOXYD12_FULL_60_8]|nr:MAG: translation initiation factor IF-3 [Alphaproteobacteria bacterium RIFOXYD12_FULL_60_8]